MNNPAKPSPHAVFEAVLAFAWVLGLGWLAKAYTRDVTQVAALWLANGVLLGFLLTAPRNRWAGLIVAGLLANVASSLIIGDSFAVTWRAGVFNLGEVLLAALPLSHGIGNLAQITLARNFG